MRVYKTLCSFVFLVSTMCLLVDCNLPVEDVVEVENCDGNISIAELSATTVEQGSTLLFVNSSNDKSQYDFNWIVGQETFSTAELNYTFDNVGEQTVTLEGRCKSTDSLYFDSVVLEVVASMPIADFEIIGSDSCGLGCSIMINNLSQNADTYLINFGDTDTQADEITATVLGEHSYRYPRSGEYIISVEARNSTTGLSNSVSKPVIITEEVTVLFQVDLRETNYEGIPRVYGSWPSSNWDAASAIQMDNIQDDIWQVSVELTNYTTYQYLFLTDNNEQAAETDLICLNNNSNVRELILTQDGEMLPTVCFGECEPCEFSCGDLFYDTRSNTKYRTIWFDEEGGNDLSKPGACWLAENISLSQGLLSQCYEFDSENCDEFGTMYVADGIATICPNGWQLPTVQQWDDLFVQRGLGRSVLDQTTTYQGDVIDFGLGGGAGLEVLLGGANVDIGFYGLGLVESHWTQEGTVILFDLGVREIYHNSIEPMENGSSYCRCVKL